jgi:aspartate/methionine/tyrosine aminotransferase
MTAPIAKRIQGMTPFHVMELLRRAKELEVAGRDVIHLEVGEPDFPTPQAVIDAGLHHIKSGQVKYTSAAGLPALREAIALYYQTQYGVKVDSKRIFITPGASGALLLALGISFDAGDEMLMADPSYPCNGNFVRFFHGNAKFIPVSSDSAFQLRPQMIEDNWSQQTKGVLIASPSNPTGTLIDDSDFKVIIDWVTRRNACLYSDEIYHGLVYDRSATTALSFSDNVFVINSFSKYFGMTGWRVGWVVVPENFIDAAEKLAQNIFIAAPGHSQVAALAAFSDASRTELERRRKQFSERRDFLYDALIKMGFFIPLKPDGAFYLYADCTQFTDDSYRFAYALLETEGVAVTPGADFGRYHAGRYLRFAYTTTVERMAEAMDRIQRFVNQ